MLPKELLIEIFAYLNFQDLCQLTSTCKLFNEIINISSTLMDKFRLVFNEKCHDLDLMISREYRRIKIRIVNQNLFKLLECCGENITEIIFILDNQLELQDFSKILNLCPNLKLLKIYTEDQLNDDLIEPLLNFAIDSLFIGKHKCFSECMPESKGKTLQIHENSASKKMLASLFKQNQLKHLALEDFELFDDDSLVNGDFQLETLKLIPYFYSNFKEENFIKFLKNQKSLCKLIAISGNVSYFYRIGDADVFKAVNELFVLGSIHDFHLPMPQIEILKIDIQDTNDENCKEKFPNLKCFSIETYNEFKIVNKFTKPKPHQRTSIMIPDSVKILKIKNTRFGNDSLFDDDVDIKIENLTICKCDNVVWLIDCFKNDRIKLKSLKIDRTKIKKSQREFLESLTQGDDKKIEKLKIHMPMRLNENHDYVFDYLIEDYIYDMTIPH